jgi:histidyl-tRNA synthetase
MMPALIEPKILKGFRDFLPSAEIVRRYLIGVIEDTCRSFGFVPIDTPALEYAEILLGKGGGETEKQIYRFKDNGQRDVALRFDLTVPFARYTALHQDELIFPFKRYHIAKVWRGENTQRGRYREFMQCDFDIIGADSPPVDFEIVLLIHSAMQALGLDTAIHLNHRGLFNAFLSKYGVSGKSVEILRAVDKISKIGYDETKKNLIQITNETVAGTILDFINAGISTESSPQSDRNSAGISRYNMTLDRITELSGGPTEMSERLHTLGRFIDDTGIADSVILDPSITRGLDYYTGVVFETFLTELPEIGSVCSGGRYDNLCGLYTKKSISGVGASIGLDRMIAAMENLDRIPKIPGYSLAVACINPENSGVYQVLAQKFRKEKISCEVFADTKGSADTKVSEPVKQFIAAEKKGIRWLIIPGQNLTDPLTLRDIPERKNHEGMSVEDVIELIRAHQG